MHLLPVISKFISLNCQNYILLFIYSTKLIKFLFFSKIKNNNHACYLFFLSFSKRNPRYKFIVDVNFGRVVRQKEECYFFYLFFSFLTRYSILFLLDTTLNLSYLSLFFAQYAILDTVFT